MRGNSKSVLGLIETVAGEKTGARNSVAFGAGNRLREIAHPLTRQQFEQAVQDLIRAAMSTGLSFQEAKKCSGQRLQRLVDAHGIEDTERLLIDAWAVSAAAGRDPSHGLITIHAARVFKKIFKLSSFDREAEGRISTAIDRMIRKWRSTQATLATNNTNAD